MTTVLQQIEQLYREQHWPRSRVVLEGEYARLTLEELTERVQAMAAFLHQQQVQTLALFAANSPEWIIADLACQEAGICLLPLPAFFTNTQLQHCLKEAAADALLIGNRLRTDALLPEGSAGLNEPVTGWWLQTLAPEQSAQMPEGTAKITFTSGSTGSPKGVCLDHNIQLAVAQSLARATALGEHRHLCLLPLSTLLENVGGVYRALLSGGTVVTLPEQQLGFSGTGFHINHLLGALDQVQPDSLIVLPELLQALNLAGEQGWLAPASLKFIAVGGAKVAPAQIEQARVLGLPVYEGYGLSECGSVVSLNVPGHDRAGSCGQPLGHQRITLQDGEIVVSGQVFLGYLNEPGSWYRASVATGDLGSLDDAGFLHISGRRKNLLISSFGRNINPEWVESEILANAAIRQCVVTGDAKPFCSAIIVSRDPALADSAIQAWLDDCNRRLPDYAQVKAWLRLPEPMSAAQGLFTENGRPKRPAITAHFNQAIEALYASSAQPVSA